MIGTILLTAICAALAAPTLVKIVKVIIKGILYFINHVVNWFKGLKLNRQKDVPFIADAKKQEFKSMLENAPNVKCGIFEGVYDEQADVISECRVVEADSLDDQTREIVNKDTLVVLS